MRRIRIPLLAAVALLGGSPLPAAVAEPTEIDELPPEVERPEFLAERPFIPDLLLKDKREGSYVTGIPALGWDAEEGFAIGGFLEHYDNGARDDPFFRTTPYRRKIFVGGVVTTQDVFRLLGRLDWPNIADSAYRIRVDSLFEQAENKNYFGIGDDASPLRSPVTGRSFRDFADYQDDLDRLIPGGQSGCPVGLSCTNARRNKYEATDAIAVVSLEREMLGGLLRPLLGFQIRYVDVDDLTGSNVEQVLGSRKALQLPTRLFEDCARGVVDGCRGGWDNLVKLGISYDSRDFEPNPTTGIFAEATAGLSAKAFGSEDDYQRVTLTASVFHDLFRAVDTDQSLILAGRATYNLYFGDPPFYAQPKLGFTTFDRSGLGGFLTLRGYKSHRFVGPSSVLLNGEVRWFFTEWHFWGQHLRPGLAAFVDTGRAFDAVQLQLEDWKLGGGGGFRLAWNLATLVSFDVGLSREDAVFYMELGTTF